MRYYVEVDICSLQEEDVDQMFTNVDGLNADWISYNQPNSLAFCIALGLTTVVTPPELPVELLERLDPPTGCQVTVRFIELDTVKFKGAQFTVNKKFIRMAHADINAKPKVT